MEFSEECVRLAKSFEGYHRALDDGSGRCIAYRCPAGKWTLGWGCTEGIVAGMIWTAEEAEAALRRELSKASAAVSRLVTAAINQSHHDALVLIVYNIGIGAFEGSTLLKRVNAQDWKRAADEFKRWTKATVDGKKVDLPGLVSRRAREAALFLKPTEAPEEPFMPHAVTAGWSFARKVWTWAASALGFGTTATVVTGGPPDVSFLPDWQVFAQTSVTFISWGVSNPAHLAFLAAWLAGSILVPKYLIKG